MADPSETTRVSRDPAPPEHDELLAAVRALATQVGDLQAELQSLRAQSRSLPGQDLDRPGWDDRSAARQDGGASWVRSLDSPTARSLPVPRLLLEVIFLGAVAALTVVASLEPPVIVAVMVAAWLLVALAEWTGARAARREEAIRHSAFGFEPPLEDTSWFTPPVERTAPEVANRQEGTPPGLADPTTD